MSTAVVERLGFEEFEPGDERLAYLVLSGLEKARSLRDVARRAINSILGTGEFLRPSFYRTTSQPEPDQDI